MVKRKDIRSMYKDVKYIEIAYLEKVEEMKNVHFDKLLKEEIGHIRHYEEGEEDIQEREVVNTTHWRIAIYRHFKIQSLA